MAAQPVRNSHSKNRVGGKTKLSSSTYTKKTYRKLSEQLFSPIGGSSVSLECQTVTQSPLSLPGHPVQIYFFFWSVEGSINFPNKGAQN